MHPEQGGEPGRGHDDDLPTPEQMHGRRRLQHPHPSVACGVGFDGIVDTLHNFQ